MPERRTTSYGVEVERRQCLACGEWCWFTANQNLCQECRSDSHPGYGTPHPDTPHSERQYHGGGTFE